MPVLPYGDCGKEVVEFNSKGEGDIIDIGTGKRRKLDPKEGKLLLAGLLIKYGGDAKSKDVQNNIEKMSETVLPVFKENLKSIVEDIYKKGNKTKMTSKMTKEEILLNYPPGGSIDSYTKNKETSVRKIHKKGNKSKMANDEIIKKEKDPKRVKIGKKSKTKGDNFERGVANNLHDLCRNIMSGEDEFKRTPMSGGWSKKKKILFGDIICPTWFPFIVSCKNTTVKKTGNFVNLILGNLSGNLNSWLEEIDALGKKVNKMPLLAIQLKNIGKFVILKVKCIKTNKQLSKELFKLRGKHCIRFGKYYMIGFYRFLEILRVNFIENKDGLKMFKKEVK